MFEEFTSSDTEGHRSIFLEIINRRNDDAAFCKTNSSQILRVFIKPRKMESSTGALFSKTYSRNGLGKLSNRSLANTRFKAEMLPEITKFGSYNWIYHFTDALPVKNTLKSRFMRAYIGIAYALSVHYITILRRENQETFGYLTGTVGPCFTKLCVIHSNILDRSMKKQALSQHEYMQAYNEWRKSPHNNDSFIDLHCDFTLKCITWSNDG